MEAFQIAQDCIKCAKCIPTCTMYGVHHDEVHTPRGLLNLLAELKAQESAGRLGDDFSHQVSQALEACFLCAECTTRCPKHLPIDFAIKLAKGNEGLSKPLVPKIRRFLNPAFVLKKIYFSLLLQPRWMDFIFSFLSFLPPCKGVGASLSHLKFHRKSFLNAQKKIQQPPSERKIGIFVGCMANYNYPQIPQALLKILQTLDCEAVFKPQVCCGAPALFSGDVKVAKILAKRNLALLSSYAEEVEAILILESTCASVMLKDWERFFDDEQNQAFQAIKSKMFLATQWLQRQEALLQKLDERRNKAALSITYHDPCHALRSLGIYQEPRILLGRAGELKEMQDPRCCGFGGVSMQLGKSLESKKVASRRAQDILSTQADVVSSECSACITQLSYHLAAAPLAKPISRKKPLCLHPVEILAKALGV